MTWVRLDDGWDTHPKMVRAMALVGDAAPSVWSRAVTRCCRHLTDGIVSRAELHSLTTHRQPRKVVDALVAVGLLEPVEGPGDLFRLHDFLDWNDSRETVEARRAVKREAGAKGGRASVQVRQGSTKSQAPCLPSASSLENPSPSPSPHHHLSPAPSSPGDVVAPGLGEVSLAAALAAQRKLAGLDHAGIARDLAAQLTGRRIATGREKTPEQLAQDVAAAVFELPEHPNEQTARRKLRSFVVEGGWGRRDAGPVVQGGPEDLPRLLEANAKHSAERERQEADRKAAGMEDTL